MNDTTIIIAGGTVICEDAVLPNHDAHINNDRIVAIRPSSQRLEQNPSDILKPTIIDAQGAFVAPGMIDVHSDYIENVASPRPSVVMDMQSSLIEADRELATHGITTMFHSLSSTKLWSSTASRFEILRMLPSLSTRYYAQKMLRKKLILFAIAYTFVLR